MEKAGHKVHARAEACCARLDTGGTVREHALREAQG